MDEIDRIQAEIRDAFGGDLQVLGDRVLLAHPPIKERIGSLWIPPEAEWMQQQLQGVVVAAGPYCDPLLAPGLRVITKRFGRIHIGNEHLWVCAEDDILATVDWD